MNRLRVATYNVHKCRGMDWRVNVQRVAKVLVEIDADLIAVQEILSSQAACFAEHLAAGQVFGPSRMLGNEEYGNAVFTRLPLRTWENYDLTVDGREPRRCLRVELECESEESLQFFAAHLGTSFFERRHQAAKLVSEQVLDRPEWNTRRIVAGDFNEWTRGLATRMLNRHLQSADLSIHLNRRKTYPGLLPFLHLDHIYYDSCFKLTGMHLHRSPAALIASDHLPLIADFHHESRLSMRTR